MINQLFKVGSGSNEKSTRSWSGGPKINGSGPHPWKNQHIYFTLISSSLSWLFCRRCSCLLIINWIQTSVKLSCWQGYILCNLIIPPPPSFEFIFFPRRISLRRAGRSDFITQKDALFRPVPPFLCNFPPFFFPVFYF